MCQEAMRVRALAKTRCIKIQVTEGPPQSVEHFDEANRSDRFILPESPLESACIQAFILNAEDLELKNEPA